MPKGKSKSDMEQEVNSGRFPPCLCYKIQYTSPKERRVSHGLLKVDLIGADVDLTFSCTLREEPSKWVHSRLCCVCMYIIYICTLCLSVDCIPSLLQSHIHISRPPLSNILCQNRRQSMDIAYFYCTTVHLKSNIYNCLLY